MWRGDEGRRRSLQYATSNPECGGGGFRGGRFSLWCCCRRVWNGNTRRRKQDSNQQRLSPVTGARYPRICDDLERALSPAAKWTTTAEISCWFNLIVTYAAEEGRGGGGGHAISHRLILLGGRKGMLFVWAFESFEWRIVMGNMVFFCSKFDYTKIKKKVKYLFLKYRFLVREKYYNHMFSFKSIIKTLLYHILCSFFIEFEFDFLKPLPPNLKNEQRP